MKYTHYTNYVHHHQIPLADEYYRILGDNYRFVAKYPLPEWLANGGYDSTITRPYIIRAYESKENENTAIKLMNDSDIVVYGEGFDEYVFRRQELNKITFHYAERWIKKISWRLFDPRFLRSIYRRYFRFRQKRSYLLCASAFASRDAQAFRCFPNKCIKWGYFPKVESFADSFVRERQVGDKVQIMWCARFLKWKHPELPVLLAKSLKNSGFNFSIDMYGSGDLFIDTQKLAGELGVNDCVSFQGNLPNERILEAMRCHDIFLFTSDRGEGWGCVLNEAMANGCACVAGNEIGAAPYLINDGENGLLFRSKSLPSLIEKVEYLLTHPDFRIALSNKALETMNQLWSPKIAAERFLFFAQNLLNGKELWYEEGPCSKA